MKHDICLNDTVPVFARIRLDPKQQVLRGVLLNVLMFAVYYIVCAVWESLCLAAFYLIYAAAAAPHSADDFFKAEPMRELLMMLFLTTVSIAVNLVFSLGIEKRPLRTLGITKRRALPDYLLGILLGTGMMGCVILLMIAGGGASFRGVSQSVPTGYMLLFLAGWMIQGFSEELTFRGWLMMSAGTHTKPLTGVAVSSLLFAAAHLGNDGISVFAFCNLTMFGLLTALLFLRTDSIWCTAAMHSFWNMAQGNLFGMKVSGIDVSATFLHIDTAEGAAWLNGGHFGPEGGAATTAILIICILAVYLLPQRTVHLPALQDAQKKGVTS